MPVAIISGQPGEIWTNTTGKILFQLHVDFVRSCAVCIQFANQIGPWWPIPYHDHCHCRNIPVKPNSSAIPFLDYQEELRRLGPVAQRNAMGASNWRLVESGVAKWDDVVTKGRVRDFREVAHKLNLSVDRMVKAGVRPDLASAAYDATHTEAHHEADQQRKALIAGLKAHGVTDDRIRAEVGNLLASRIGIVGPDGKGSGVTPPPQPPAPKPPAVKPIPAAPAKVAALSPAKSVRDRNIDAAVAFANARGVEVIRDARVYIAKAHGEAKADRTAAQYAHRYGKIFINEKHRVWDDPGAFMEESSRTGWFSSDSTDHIIAHEVGHALNERAVGNAKYRELRERKFRPNISASIRENVSVYASTAPVEFVAEVYAGLSAGKSYNNAVMDLYRMLGGLEP